MAVYSSATRMSCANCHHELFSEQDLFLYEKSNDGAFIKKMIGQKQYTCENCGKKYSSVEFLNGAILI